MEAPRVQFKVRQMIGVVAVVALALGGAVGIRAMDRRADFLRRQADYHGRMERELAGRAADWDALANDPSKESDLRLALYQAGKWSQERALELELEPLRAPSRPRWRQFAPEARNLALQQSRTYQREAECHGRQKRRYDQAAFTLWLPDAPLP
jgi:hypothetical protein